MCSDIFTVRLAVRGVVQGVRLAPEVSRVMTGDEGKESTNRAPIE